jgi:hypothetical protein
METYETFGVLLECNSLRFSGARKFFDRKVVEKNERCYFVLNTPFSFSEALHISR